MALWPAKGAGDFYNISGKKQIFLFFGSWTLTLSQETQTHWYIILSGKKEKYGLLSFFFSLSLRSCSFIMFFACLREKLFHAWRREASAELGCEAVVGRALWEQGPQAGHCGAGTGKVEVWKTDTLLAILVQ